jgi:hypothetical protein
VKSKRTPPRRLEAVERVAVVAGSRQVLAAVAAASGSRQVLAAVTAAWLIGAGLACNAAAGSVRPLSASTAMPFAGLGLDIPDWDDACVVRAPALGLKKPKAQKPEPKAQKPEPKAQKPEPKAQKPSLPAGKAGKSALPAAAAAVAAAPQQMGVPSGAASPLGTPKKVPAKPALVATASNPATGKADHKRKREGPAVAASKSPAPASAGGDAEQVTAGAKKKKKKGNGKHSKNKGGGGVDAAAAANGSPAPKIAKQQQGKDAKEAVTAKAARESAHSLTGEAGEAGKQGRKKKRKRKNKFAGTGEDAEAGGKGGAGQADTRDQPEGECSRKKLKLQHRQDADSGRGGKNGCDNSLATADVHISASTRKEEKKPKGMGNMATAVGAERVGQGVKGVGGGGARVKDLARGRETRTKKLQAMESKAKGRSKDWEEKKEVATQPNFPFQHMSSLASNRSKLTPLQAKLAAKLQGAHFRMLNEQLYTTPSSSAVAHILKRTILHRVTLPSKNQGTDF